MRKVDSLFLGSLRGSAVLFLLLFEHVYSRQHNQYANRHLNSIGRELLVDTELEQNEVVKDSDIVVLPSRGELSGMGASQLAALYHKYINSIQVLCENIKRLGQLGDGGWDICDDSKYRPRDNCLVYSFGIDYDFSFDDDIAKTYGCEVHSFDPSMESHNHKHDFNVYFHQAGLSGTKETAVGTKWQMNTLSGYKKDLGHSKRSIDILKLDIEQWEWSALNEIVMSNSLRDVKQIIIEFHATVPKTEPSSVEYARNLSILKDMYDLGFKIFWTHRNLFCIFYSIRDAKERTGCHEVSFVNVNSST